MFEQEQNILWLVFFFVENNLKTQRIGNVVKVSLSLDLYF